MAEYNHFGSGGGGGGPIAGGVARPASAPSTVRYDEAGVVPPVLRNRPAKDKWRVTEKENRILQAKLDAIKRGPSRIFGSPGSGRGGGSPAPAAASPPPPETAAFGGALYVSKPQHQVKPDVSSNGDVNRRKQQYELGLANKASLRC